MESENFTWQERETQSLEIEIKFILNIGE